MALASVGLFSSRSALVPALLCEEMVFMRNERIVLGQNGLSCCEFCDLCNLLSMCYESKEKLTSLHFLLRKRSFADQEKECCISSCVVV